MFHDEVGLLARGDELIVCLGNESMQRNVGNPRMRPSYTSANMRLTANMLLHLRKIPVEHTRVAESQQHKLENNLWDYIRPQHFDKCVQAGLSTAQQDMDDMEDLRSPSNAIKLRYEIKRLCNIKLGFAIRARDQQAKDECRDFMDLMRNEWGIRVTKLAHVKLLERQYQMEKKLPLPADLVKLNTYIGSELRTFDTTDMSSSNFRAGAELAEAKLISYNRRRVGEVQALRLDSYAKRKIGTTEVDVELTRELSDFENHLLKSQEVVVIRGKTGKGVPLIIPDVVRSLANYLTNQEVLVNAGIQEENIYVFASSRGLGVVRGYDSLSHTCRKAGLQQPEMITSVNLRKYMATITQVLDLSRNQLDWVCDHLGHSLNVHRTYYRAHSDVLERIEIAKILLLQDNGLVNQFIGKRLKDIQLTDIVFPNVHSQHAEHQQSPSTSTSQLPSSTSDVIPNEPSQHHLYEIATAAHQQSPSTCTSQLPSSTSQLPSSTSDVDSQHMDTCRHIDDTDSDDELASRRKKRRISQFKRQRWSLDEEGELKNFFSRFLTKKECLRYEDLDKAMAKSKKQDGLI